MSEICRLGPLARSTSSKRSTLALLSTLSVLRSGRMTSRVSSSDATPVMDAVEQAYAEYDKEMAEAWRNVR